MYRFLDCCLADMFYYHYHTLGFITIIILYVLYCYHILKFKLHDKIVNQLVHQCSSTEKIILLMNG